MLHFNAMDQISGVQSCFPPENNMFDDAADYNEDSLPIEHNVILDGKRYSCLTVFFRDPAHMCRTGAESAQRIGEGLWMKQSNGKFSPLVPRLDEVPTPMYWEHGFCSPELGTHYVNQQFYAGLKTGVPNTHLSIIRKHYPVFLMYNDGYINGFGWILNNYYSKEVLRVIMFPYLLP